MNMSLIKNDWIQACPAITGRGSCCGVQIVDPTTPCCAKHDKRDWKKISTSTPGKVEGIKFSRNFINFKFKIENGTLWKRSTIPKTTKKRKKERKLTGNICKKPKMLPLKFLDTSPTIKSKCFQVMCIGGDSWAIHHRDLPAEKMVKRLNDVKCKADFKVYEITLSNNKTVKILRVFQHDTHDLTSVLRVLLD